MASSVVDLWIAGQTRRWHTDHVALEQRVNAHQWGVVMLIITLHPAPSTSLLRAAIYHDLPETVTGDTPAPFKWRNPGFKFVLDDAEKKVAIEMGIDINITEEEKRWLKAADKLEALLFAFYDAHMGNKFARDIVQRLTDAILESIEKKTYPIPLLAPLIEAHRRFGDWDIEYRIAGAQTSTGRS